MKYIAVTKNMDFGNEFDSPKKAATDVATTCIANNFDVDNYYAGTLVYDELGNIISVLRQTQLIHTIVQDITRDTEIEERDANFLRSDFYSRASRGC